LSHTFKTLSVAIALVAIFNGCGGTHGGITTYCYSTNHHKLDSAISMVIRNNNDIRRDTSDWDGYNENEYFVILIDEPEGTYQYNMRFYGNADSWEIDSLNSCMFIWGMYDPDKRGGWSKDFNVTNNSLKKKLLSVATEKLITRIDGALGIKHVVKN
jgi:hypothetical protein